MQFFDCSNVFWPELSEFQEKKFKRIRSRKMSISQEFELLATNKPIESLFKDFVMKVNNCTLIKIYIWRT